MRYLSIILSLALLLPFLFCSIPHISAVEPQAEWADPSYWESLDFDELSNTTWESALVWLEANADLPLLLHVRNQTDGMFSTDISGLLSKRFQKEPTEFLSELSKESTAVWQDCAFCVIYGADDWDAMIEILESIRLSEPNAEKAYEVLAFMIDYAEELYHTEIHNPKTGDSVDVLVAVLAISGLFGGVLLTQRKRFV